MNTQLRIVENIVPVKACQVNQQEGTKTGTTCFAEQLQKQQEKLENISLQPTSDNKANQKSQTEHSQSSDKSAEPEKTTENAKTPPKTENDNKKTVNTDEKAEQPTNDNTSISKELIISPQVQAAQKAILNINAQISETQQTDVVLPKLTKDVIAKPAQKQVADIIEQATPANPDKNVNPNPAVPKNPTVDLQTEKSAQNSQQLQSQETIQGKPAEKPQPVIKNQPEQINTALSSKSDSGEVEKAENAPQISSKLIIQAQTQPENKNIQPQQPQQQTIAADTTKLTIQAQIQLENKNIQPQQPQPQPQPQQKIQPQPQTTTADTTEKQKGNQADVFSAGKEGSETGTTEKKATQLIASLQMQTEQKDGKSGPDNAKNGLNQVPEQLTAGNLPKEQNAEQINSSNQLRFSNQANSTSVGIERQVQESIQSSLHQGAKQITIRLNPPELGNVSLKFEEKGGEITGLLQVSKIETRYQVEQAVPQIIRNLADAGIVIKKLEVTLSSTSEQNTSANSFLNTSQNQQQNFNTAGHEPADNSYFDYSFSQQADAWITTGAEQAVLTENSINILI